MDNTTNTSNINTSDANTQTNTIYSINGPVVRVRGGTALAMQEMVYVSEARLIGEVIGIDKSAATIQVYENTTGIRPGEPVWGTGHPMSATLGPGLITGIYDGIGRPLQKIEAASGSYIARGLDIPMLDPEKQWWVDITMAEGAEVRGGEVVGECDESAVIRHRIMIPPNTAGTVQNVRHSGLFKVNDALAQVKSQDGAVTDVTMCQHWPIRTPRPMKARISSNLPFVTGQRIIDTLFPIALGGTAGIPGAFGTGKTMLQHQLAKWSDADIIVYVGCGERGNEMTQVLEEFAELIDPKNNKSMLERTVLIANTSNMPVAAREASIYTGVTIAEYYRDMGYNVAMMADSTSRWAEALREISGRLEEMPAEEGFPAYLPSRLAAFYERAGLVESLDCGRGSVTIIGAVSPMGGDLSEPVTQNTKRFIRCFWALDKPLAYARHYPAIDWMTSYSEYVPQLADWFSAQIAPDFMRYRDYAQKVLGDENSLMEIVKLIGSDLLADEQKLTLETARALRLGFLQQNFMHPNDAFVPVSKQYHMMKLIMDTHDGVQKLLAQHIPFSAVKDRGVFDKLVSMKYSVPNDKPELFGALAKEIDGELGEIAKANGDTVGSGQ